MIFMNLTLESPLIKAPPIETTAGNYFISDYPPLSSWTPEEIPKYLHALAAKPKAAPISLHVHLPFCRQRCQYCYSHTYPHRADKDVNVYVDAVLNELSLYRRYPAIENRSFNAIYLGGGSPSSLSLQQIGNLLGGLQEQISWETVEECTFDCDPGTLLPEKLQLLKRLGVTRLSLGFQTLDDEVLRRSRRETRAGDCLRAFHQAREAGFDEINIDLIAGLPGETGAKWKRTVDQVLELVPDCVTIYQLELPYDSVLHASIQSGCDVPLPSWPMKCHWTDIAFKMCEGAGYVLGSGYTAIRNPQWWRFVYTVENFWHGADLLALGETASGYINGVHYRNADSFDHYTGPLAENHLPLQRALKLSPEERLRREVILLLKIGQLDAAHFREKFGVELLDHFEPQFEKLLQRNLIEVEGGMIRLTREALLRVDWLLPMFYLPEHAGVR